MRPVIKYPAVMSEDLTLDLALAGHSLSRFGDGELRLATGGKAKSQEAHNKLRFELISILRKSKALACIPNLQSDTPEMWFWAKYLNDAKINGLYDRHRRYGSTWVARPDCAPWIERPDYWEKMRRLWIGKRVLLIAGEEKCFTTREMLADGAQAAIIVAGPRVNAYAQIDAIEAAALQSIKAFDLQTVILSLGATATVLAERLAARGVHAVDLGHAGMFMRRSAGRLKQIDIVSPAYRELLREQHARGSWGTAGRHHAALVDSHARKLNAQTILDYGCGRGTLKPSLVAMGWTPADISEYDPGIADKAALPQPADYVVCTDVLEHVEGDRVRATLQHLKALARKGMFLQIATKPAKETLPDGRNAHITVQKPGWWLDQLRRVWLNPIQRDTKKGLRLWIEV